MKLHILLICLFSGALGAKLKGVIRNGNEKIIGGASTKIQDAPYQLQLELEAWQICGASIISQFFALTSASCVDGYNQRQLTLRAGSDRKSYGGHIHQVYKITIHEKYDSYTHDYDVAVLEVATPFRLDETTQIVPIALTLDMAQVGTATGWGRTSEEGSESNQLLSVDIPLIPRTNCTTIYAGDITLRMLCAGTKGHDVCSGDTGGPLVQNGLQIGISSWSYGCARDGYPGVYTNLVDVDIRNFISTFIS